MASQSDLKVLCGEPLNYSKAGLEMVSSVASLRAVTLTQEEFAAESVDYDVLMVRLQMRVTADIITKSSRLKAVISPTTGLDHIDLEAANQHNIVVFSLHGETSFLENIYSTAEYTFALLLSLIRNIPSAAAAVKQNRIEQNQYRGHELHGKNLGIIGCGRLGNMVARYGYGFGMHLLGYDPYKSELPEHVERCDELDELLSRSDILLIHVPLNESTKGMISTRELSLLDKGAYVVNTSRGAIVDEDALIDAIESGHLGGAAVDVLTNEQLIPTQGHRLIELAKTHSNVLITPHIAGAAEEAIEKTDIFVINKFCDWINE